jgi:hypothetical protein
MTQEIFVGEKEECNGHVADSDNDDTHDVVRTRQQQQQQQSQTEENIDRIPADDSIIPTINGEDNYTKDVLPSTTTVTSKQQQQQQQRNLLTKVKLCISKWPRTKAILFKMLLLWTLILWALCLGWVLSRIEGPAEIQANDDVLRQKWFFIIPVQELLLVISSLPTICFKRYINLLHNSTLIGDELNITQMMEIQDMSLSEFNNSNNLFDYSFSNQKNENRIPELLLTLPTTLVNQTNNTKYETLEDVFESFYEYMERCDAFAQESIYQVLNYSLQNIQETGLEIQDLSFGQDTTFNWIRCWNNALLGHTNPWKPTSEQISASADQGRFFLQQWLNDRQTLFDEYVTGCYSDDVVDNVTRARCVVNASQTAVLQATGGKQCASNTGSSAWFWFVVMTSTL